ARGKQAEPRPVGGRNAGEAGSGSAQEGVVPEAHRSEVPIRRTPPKRGFFLLQLDRCGYRRGLHAGYFWIIRQRRKAVGNVELVWVDAVSKGIHSGDGGYQELRASSGNVKILLRVVDDLVHRASADAEHGSLFCAVAANERTCIGLSGAIRALKEHVRLLIDRRLTACARAAWDCVQIALGRAHAEHRG